MAKGGSLPYKPTKADRQTVELMIAAGIAQEAICKCIGEKGIDDKTLRKHFRKELDTAASTANAVIAKSLFQQAKNGNVTAAIWWTKSRMRWSEKKEIEHTGHMSVSELVDQG